MYNLRIIKINKSLVEKVHNLPQIPHATKRLVKSNILKRTKMGIISQSTNHAFRIQQRHALQMAL